MLQLAIVLISHAITGDFHFLALLPVATRFELGWAQNGHSSERAELSGSIGSTNADRYRCERGSGFSTSEIITNHVARSSLRTGSRATTATSRTRPRLVSGWGCLGRRLFLEGEKVLACGASLEGIIRHGTGVRQSKILNHPDVVG